MWSQPSHAGGGVELLGDRHKRNAAAVKDLDELGKIGERARQPVDLVNDVIRGGSPWLSRRHSRRNSSRPSDRMRSISPSIARVSIEAMARRPVARRSSASICWAGRQSHDKRVRPRPSPISGSSQEFESSLGRHKTSRYSCAFVVSAVSGIVPILPRVSAPANASRQPETQNAGVWGANGRRVSQGRFRVVECGAFRLGFDGGLGGEAENMSLFTPVVPQVLARLRSFLRKTGIFF